MYCTYEVQYIHVMYDMLNVRCGVQYVHVMYVECTVCI